MIYTSIKEKIKYFNPAFHSMTPEGLNARLTFLNQCVRPGETIPVIGADGRPKYNDAVNTSFGAPPVLVLRIGDFYHTKIIPKSLSFTYDNNLLDMNPEGIGIQPMVVKVTLGFDMIGGHGLAKPVEELQNALSFNYYANTEIYDERATPTDDSYKKIDKELEQLILASEKPATINNVTNNPTNDGGDTIGEIQTNIPIPAGQTGVISYQKFMDKFFDETVTYFNTVINQMEKITLTYNMGIMELVNDKRKNTNGTIYENGTPSPPENGINIIWGQPDGDNTRLTQLFTDVLEYINSDQNPIITGLLKTSNQSGYNPIDPEIVELKINLTNYIKKLSTDFSNGIVTTYTDLVNFEANYVQYFRKINLLETKTDGKILESNVPRVYNITGTQPVSDSSIPPIGQQQNSETNFPFGIPNDTFEELDIDYKTIVAALKNYDKLLETSGITAPDEYNDGDFKLADVNTNFDIQDKLFFMVISRILDDKNKKQEFIKTLTKGVVVSRNAFKNKLEKVVEKLQNKYSKELRKEEKLFEKFRKNKDFKTYVDEPLQKLFPKGKTRKFDYTTVPGSNDETQKADILALYTKKTNILEF